MWFSVIFQGSWWSNALKNDGNIFLSNLEATTRIAVDYARVDNFFKIMLVSFKQKFLLIFNGVSSVT